jgi:dolichol-phosphate mannosyltransferase
MQCTPPLLSVIVPVYNERGTISEIIDRVLSLPLSIEVIIVDDGSTDGTELILKEWDEHRRIKLISHASNRGKGAAIRTGLRFARGEFTIIQDGDLEYNPGDYPLLLAPLVASRAQVVYGVRPKPATVSIFSAGVSLLNLLVAVLYGQRISDEATCYKVMRTQLLRSLDLRCERFEFCTEVTAKVCQLGITIHEVPVSYSGRSSADGKKIQWYDGVEAIVSLIRWKWWRPPDRAVDAVATYKYPYHNQTS